jgi:holo-[acyl-carrier protein] synthase
MVRTLHVGADVISISQVSDSIDRFGDRYLHRIFTDHEIDTCVGSPSVVAASLAARFAAKEATIKVLRPVDYQPDWRSIEVKRDDEGGCTLSLSGHAATLAAQAGISELAVSLTHDDGRAAAVVIALGQATDRPESPDWTQLSQLLANGDA